MTDEIKNESTEEVDYVQAIQELKANSVPKEQYAKLKDENAKLLKSLINGETLEAESAEAKPSIADLRKELYSGDWQGRDIDYARKTLELRTAVIESGGADPFLPVGHKVIPDDNDISCARKAAEVMQDCIDFADGDNGVFLAELQRRMIDYAPKRK